MTETISGLHSCKPGNEPVQGETKTFVIEQHPAKNGKKAWTKIKSAGPKFGGEPYLIISAEPTGFTDSYGNISFNLEIEPATNEQYSSSNIPVEDQPVMPPAITRRTLGGGGENTQKPVQAASSPSQNFNGLDDRALAFIRQHSQSMALEVLKLKVTLNELTVEDLTPAKLRSLADYFDSDVLRATK